MSHNAKELPSKEYLESKFTYDEDQGILISKKTNKEIRRKDASGYPIVTIDGKVRRVNRVIWKIKTGEDPEGIVDYIDGDYTNNSWTNLRVVDEKEFYVRKREKDIDNGLDLSESGVSYYKRNKTWRVQIRIDGVPYSKYGFKTKDEAVEHAKQAISGLIDNMNNKEKLEEEKKAREEIINDLFG